MCAGRGHNCKLQENLRECCRLAAFAGVLHSFFALELNKIIFLLRWRLFVQDYLQGGACGVCGAEMATADGLALRGAAGQ